MGQGLACGSCTWEILQAAPSWAWGNHTPWSTAGSTAGQGERKAPGVFCLSCSLFMAAGPCCVALQASLGPWPASAARLPGKCA